MFALALLFFVAACGPSPKSKASDWAGRFPAEIGPFELDDDRLELTLENPAPQGHVTLEYEGPDDLRLYISIDVFATEQTAEVELARWMRDWELGGVRFEDERVSGEELHIATPPGGYLVYYPVKETVLSLQVLPAPVESEDGAEANTGAPLFTPLPMEDLELVLETMVGIAENRD